MPSYDNNSKNAAHDSFDRKRYGVELRILVAGCMVLGHS